MSEITLAGARQSQHLLDNAADIAVADTANNKSDHEGRIFFA
ncbi:hypothetical protein SPSYN_01241 [Sporotomaculum syntrophicum]|uniref:Uncharacterized protein n=1 Tax=Sporotomaculum syntrophicum TaxID=182264 RepID=A0A9D3AW84_9FIRM|nr:hypothetical protein [Sporotomaculum syntrophicum]KAF1085105.1 hypothetical protein SPSYN_01241 [Sporotomaculum syntrophicum]